MQELVSAIRSTSATNLIMLGGIMYANSLTQWLKYKPHDPLNNLAASWHSYNFNRCVDKSCWDSTIGNVANHVPVILGEVGQNDCSGWYVNKLLDWVDSKQISYLGWTYNTWDCKSGPALISNYNGTPTPFGQAIKDRLARVGKLRVPGRFIRTKKNITK